MRNLFLALVLVNLLVWAGFSWFGPGPQPISRYAGPGITLVREVEAAAESGLRFGERRIEGGTVVAAAVDSGDAASETDATRAGSEADDGDETREPEAAGDPARVADSDVAGAPDNPGADAATTDGRNDAAQASRAAASRPVGQRCLAVGPFVEPADADAALDRLAREGFSSRQVDSEEEIWDGYWVYLPGIESNQAANAMLEDLEANGVEDTQLISRPDTGILISLGVYSGLTRAGTRAEQVSRLGYEATVSERTRVAEVTWLEVTLDNDQSIEIDPLRPPGRISRLELRACRN